MIDEKWIQVEPKNYDEPHEVEALEMEPGFFISPYDVPDGIRVTYDGELFRIFLRYLTDEEESRTSKSDYPDFDLCFGKYSDRMIGMETNCLPAWDDIMETLSAARKRVNHYVAWTVLRDFWPLLLAETRKLREANR